MNRTNNDFKVGEFAILLVDLTYYQIWGYGYEDRKDIAMKKGAVVKIRSVESFMLSVVVAAEDYIPEYRVCWFGLDRKYFAPLKYRPNIKKNYNR